ncbi:hypothetical protein OBBRIDRAFT_71375 [Obba rivulosa]|uniref:Uncharacterized protein n=1 Tax=Obba rivulosa TaxID=1052685 RepID=A0A8E2DJ22_9APHY|nr:hypothetical protein OBBRIDRAFT_71375 [Obba rivulosa]
MASPRSFWQLGADLLSQPSSKSDGGNDLGVHVGASLNSWPWIWLFPKWNAGTFRATHRISACKLPYSCESASRRKEWQRRLPRQGTFNTVSATTAHCRRVVTTDGANECPSRSFSAPLDKASFPGFISDLEREGLHMTSARVCLANASPFRSLLECSLVREASMFFINAKDTKFVATGY